MPSSLTKFVSAVLLVLQVLVASSRGQVLSIPLRDCGTSHAHSHRTDDCLHRALGTTSLAGDDTGRDAASVLDVAFADSVEHCCCHLHVPVPGEPQLPRQGRATSLQPPPIDAWVARTVDCRLQFVEATPSFAALATSTPRHELMTLRSTRLRI